MKRILPVLFLLAVPWVLPLVGQAHDTGSLTAEGLQEASDDTLWATDTVGEWLTLQGEQHVGTFVEANWQGLLGCLALLVGSIVIVRFGRKQISEKLQKMAARVPQLRREAVTVEEENQVEKAAQEESEAALKVAEQEALTQASQQPEDQKPVEEGDEGED